MKKWLSILLCLMLVLSCASLTAAAEEKPTLTIWITEDLRIEDYETNYQTKWLEDQLGVNLNFEVQPSADFATKVNMALTVGALEELPDIITGVNMSDASIWEWAQAGTIIPLTDYYSNPELAVHINKAIERTGTDYPKQIVSPDGNIYALATFNQSFTNEYPHKLYFYGPWLEQLGAELPTTTEEFYQLLKKAKETDLNGNGKADEIPMVGTRIGTLYGGHVKYLMNAFVYAGDHQYRVVEDGVVSAAYTTEEWKEGIKFIKKLMDEDLLLSESLTMAEEQFKTVVNADEVTVFCFSYVAPDMFNDLERAREYGTNGMGVLTGPKNVQYATYLPSIASARYVITANCKHPELAFKLGDLLSSEYMGIVERWGEEGLHWDYAANSKVDLKDYQANIEGFPIYIIAYDDTTFWAGTATANGSWRQKGPFVRQYEIANGRAIPANGEPTGVGANALQSVYQESDWAPEEVIPKLIFTSEEGEAIYEIESILKTYVEENLAAFVTGTKDVDAEWDAYLAELDKIGLQKYLEVVQTAYDRMYK